MKAIPIVPGRGQRGIAVSARVHSSRPQIVFGISAALSRKLDLEPGRVSLSVEADRLVLDVDPPEDAPSYALYREGEGESPTLAVAVTKSLLPAFGSHRWVDPDVRGRKIFLPLSKECVTRWMKERAR